MNGKRLYLPLFAVLVLLFAVLACGGDETPEEVGPVAASLPQPTLTAVPEHVAPGKTEEAPPAETSAPTEEPTPQPTPPNYKAGDAKHIFAVGDVVQMGNFTLTVKRVAHPLGDDYNKPDEGYRYLVVDVSITNNGPEAANLSSMMQMFVKDSTGQVYDLDFMASAASGGTTPDGEIPPGEMLRGQVGYQVPQNATGLVFVFDAGVWHADKVFVALP